jgi:hypothetical protein
VPSDVIHSCVCLCFVELTLDESNANSAQEAPCGSPLSVRSMEVSRTVGWTGTITDVHRLCVCVCVCVYVV